jgi:hypothetical protein
LSRLECLVTAKMLPNSTFVVAFDTITFRGLYGFSLVAAGCVSSPGISGKLQNMYLRVVASAFAQLDTQVIVLQEATIVAKQETEA